MRESSLYRQQIEAAAKPFGLDPDLVEAIVIVESSGLTHAYRHEPAFWKRYLADDPDYAGKNPRRVSSSYGLMQVMYPTAVDHGFSQPPEVLFVPEHGLYWGCRHLASLLKQTKDTTRALAAYNGGLGRVRSTLLPPDLARYVNKVNHALATVRSDAARPAPAG